jgi:hypothetical protein
VAGTVIVAVTLIGSAVALAGVRLQPAAAAAWDVYVSATETRIARELKSPGGFLALDFQSDAASTRRALETGDVIVQPMDAPRVNGRAVETPSARVEHWRGAVLIAGVTTARLVDELEHGPPPSDDILKSTVLERGEDWMVVSLRLQRKTVISVVYDTEHVVTFTRETTSRATSTSTAIRIAEVADVNTPQEHPLGAGEDRGFLWRLNAYWRYQDVPGGVIAECESISLSRDIPTLVRFVVSPLVERTARESMTRTLVALRTRFAR